VLEARRDAQPQVCWNGICVQRHADQLRLVAGRAEPALESVPWTLHQGIGVLELGGSLGRLELARDAHGPVDLQALPRRLTVRARRGGERLRPRVGGPSRTLKSLLQQGGMPPELRSRVPLLTDAERVLAAGDLWLDASIQAGPRTRRRGRLVWHRDQRLC
jgi:tRNA(Ile)-lysidine synthase